MDKNNIKRTPDNPKRTWAAYVLAFSYIIHLNMNSVWLTRYRDAATRLRQVAVEHANENTFSHRHIQTRTQTHRHTHKYYYMHITIHTWMRYRAADDGMVDTMTASNSFYWWPNLIASTEASKCSLQLHRVLFMRMCASHWRTWFPRITYATKLRKRICPIHYLFVAIFRGWPCPTPSAPLAIKCITYEVKVHFSWHCVRILSK